MSVSGVIARLRAVGEPLPDGDGVRWFNQLYLRVTERVDERLRAGDLFEEPRFVQRLDEVFAERYLAAVRTGSSRAWEPLLRARGDARVHPGAFMLAGVNAHVNYDLPIALVRTRELVGGELERDTPRHRDFERIDVLLAETERELHDRLGSGRLEGLVALRGVVRSRSRLGRGHLPARAGRRSGPPVRVPARSRRDGGRLGGGADPSRGGCRPLSAAAPRVPRG